MNNWSECQSLTRRGDVAQKAWTYFTDPDRCESEKEGTLCLQDLIRFCFELFKAFPENQNHKKNMSYQVWETSVKEVATETARKILEDLDEDEVNYVVWEQFRNFFIHAVGPDADYSELTLETYGGSVDHLNCPPDLQGIRKAELEARRSIERAVIKYKIGQFYLRYVDSECREIKTILSKTSINRTKADVACLKRILSDVPFIQGFHLPDTDLSEVCRHLKFMQFERETTIFKQDEIDSRFFFVLQGTILIKVKSNLGHFSEEQVVAVLERGESFGQYSLLTDAPRMGTAVTFTHTKVIYMDFDAFDSTILTQQKRLMEQRIQVLRSIEAFSACTDEQIKKVAEVCMTRTFKQDEVVVQQGDQSDAVYIIKTGRVRVVQQVKAESIGVKCTKGNNDGYAFLDVNEIGPCSLFGEIGVLKNCRRTASVITSSRCVMYMLRKTDFLRRIGKKAVSTFEALANSYPNDRQLRARLHHTKQWDTYRNTLTEISTDVSIPKYMGAADLPTFAPLQGI